MKQSVQHFFEKLNTCFDNKNFEVIRTLLFDFNNYFYYSKTNKDRLGPAFICSDCEKYNSFFSIIHVDSAYANIYTVNISYFSEEELTMEYLKTLQPFTTELLEILNKKYKYNNSTKTYSESLFGHNIAIDSPDGKKYTPNFDIASGKYKTNILSMSKTS